MDQEHKQEIIDEEHQEEREEPYHVWKEENNLDLEIGFLNTYSDKQILDDDLPDFMDDYADEYDQYCKDRYNEGEK